jgi:hypothetical protein
MEGVICYHVTTEDRLQSILLYGLKPNSISNRSARKAPHIMLSLYPMWNLYKNWKKNKANILLEIRHPKITLDMFVDDPEGLAFEDVILPKFILAVIKFEVLR